MAPASLLLALVTAPSSVPPPIPSDYELHWRAPEQCPDAGTIRERIAALRGDRVGGEGIAIVVADVTVGADGGYTLALTTTFATGTHARELHATQCDELGESTAIVVAVALRRGIEAAMTPADGPLPAIEIAPSTAVPEPVEPMPHTPIAADAAPFEPEPPPPRASPSIAADPIARIEGVGEIGALGVITGGGRLVFGLEWRQARIELSGLYLAPRRRRIADGRGASFQGGAVGVRGCWIPRTRGVTVPVCAGFEAGTVRADNRGIAPSKTLHTPWAGPTVGAGLVRSLGPVRVWLGVDAVIRIAGTDFRIEREVVFQQWPVSLRWSLGLEIPLGRGARREQRRENDTSARAR